MFRPRKNGRRRATSVPSRAKPSEADRHGVSGATPPAVCIPCLPSPAVLLALMIIRTHQSTDKQTERPMFFVVRLRGRGLLFASSLSFPEPAENKSPATAKRFYRLPPHTPTCGFPETLAASRAARRRRWSASALRFPANGQSVRLFLVSRSSGINNRVTPKAGSVCCCIHTIVDSRKKRQLKT